MIDQAIRQLVDYGLRTGLVGKDDEIYTVNRLLELLEIEEYEDRPAPSAKLEDILKALLDYAVETGVMKEDGIVYRDLFDTKLMGALTGRPGEVIEKFRKLYQESPRKATDFYYQFSQDTDYIRRYRIKKDQKWTTPTAYGDLDITINLSKPEKDPKAIAAAKLAKQSGYPK